MIIRLATENDIQEAAMIYDQAREYMKQNGNPDQWSGVYPNGDDVLEGIKNGTSYVCEDNGEVVATFYFEENSNDPSYAEIYDGEWKNNDAYAVIHRIAVKYHGKGIVDFCFEECFRRFPNLKIDTHESNIPMIKSLKRCGFEYCGIVYIASIPDRDMARRVAYQKTK